MVTFFTGFLAFGCLCGKEWQLLTKWVLLTRTAKTSGCGRLNNLLPSPGQKKKWNKRLAGYKSYRMFSVGVSPLYQKPLWQTCNITRLLVSLLVMENEALPSWYSFVLNYLFKELLSRRLERVRFYHCVGKLVGLRPHRKLGKQNTDFMHLHYALFIWLSMYLAQKY